MSDNVFDTSDPQRLADLLRMGTGGGVWHEHEAQQLLRFELASMPAAQWPALRELLDATDPPIRTLRELLEHRDPPREALQIVHDAYHDMDDQVLPPEVSQRIGRIAAARLADESADQWRKWLNDV